MKGIVLVYRSHFSDLIKKNQSFVKKTNKYQKDLYIHQKASKITDSKVQQYIGNTSKEQLAHKIQKQSSYDNELRSFIKQFNTTHKNRISLLDFTQYTTQFGELKNTPLKKSDLDVLKQFQKRKIDQQVSDIRQKYQENYKEDQTGRPISPAHIDFKNELKRQQKQRQGDEEELKYEFFPTGMRTDEQHCKFSQGPLKIQDQFMMFLLNIGVNTKVTTLNRINSFRTLVFMGNGNGIISHGKGKDLTMVGSLNKAITQCKKNLIAIPRDPRCTFPLAIHKKFQDFDLYMRPLPSFNSWGHPTMCALITSAGIDHCGFRVVHSEKNVYNVVNVFYKTITKNTTPKQLAEREGFKVYRHQFVRPLTHVNMTPLISK